MVEDNAVDTTPVGKRKKEPKKNSRQSRPVRAVKGTPWTFPKNTLEDAICVAKAIEDKNGGNPMRSEMLARAVGFNQPNDWRFQDLMKAARMYGLTSGAGPKVTIGLEKIGHDIVAPSSPQQRQDALRQAFHNVEPFKKVDDFYKGKRIPEDEYFLNTLTRDFGIARDRVEKFAEIFSANLQFLRSFDVSTEAEPRPTVAEVQSGAAQQEGLTRTSRPSKEPRVRLFLDACFVMMPFGSWYDRYYQDIYVPAIRDAGFEPVRADELFSTGSVVEQIWEQIEKSKVLLAELTDKNANVFYELGQAHAAGKPVVFTAGRVDDVPFDLRHLRVIVYETREPLWADKLQRLITDYLQNAAKDPARSIPHPFRTLVSGHESS